MTPLCCNCRALGRTSAVQSLKYVIRSHLNQIIGLMETKKKRRDWEKLRIRLEYLNCFTVDELGLSGGLALLWKEGVEDWNTSNFGKVEKRINSIKEEVEKLSSQRRTSDVLNEEKGLTEEPDEWLVRDEFMWRQRCRVEWLKDGD
ncbi:hypothetical protein QQ045_020079 [Rhodiola kirilowii]